jgi:hypothetical protein
MKFRDHVAQWEGNFLCHQISRPLANLATLNALYEEPIEFSLKIADILQICGLELTLPIFKQGYDISCFSSKEHKDLVFDNNCITTFGLKNREGIIVLNSFATEIRGAIKPGFLHPSNNLTLRFRNHYQGIHGFFKVFRRGLTLDLLKCIGTNMASMLSDTERLIEQKDLEQDLFVVQNLQEQAKILLDSVGLTLIPPDKENAINFDPTRHATPLMGEIETTVAEVSYGTRDVITGVIINGIPTVRSELKTAMTMYAQAEDDLR